MGGFRLNNPRSIIYLAINKSPRCPQGNQMKCKNDTLFVAEPKCSSFALPRTKKEKEKVK
jgi:hypothetical protein